MTSRKTAFPKDKVNFWVFKCDEPEFEVKTNSGPQVCPLLVEGPHCACVEHARAHAHTHTHTHMDVTSPSRADPNFLTHFTAKGKPSTFEWSTLSM